MRLQTVIIRKGKEQGPREGTVGGLPRGQEAVKVIRGQVHEEGRTGRDGLGSEATGCSLSA